VPVSVGREFLMTKTHTSPPKFKKANNYKMRKNYKSQEIIVSIPDATPPGTLGAKNVNKSQTDKPI
jgi:hypothetical protein